MQAAINSGKVCAKYATDQYLTARLDEKDFLPWYLAGRAYLVAKHYKEAHFALQEAIYRNGRSPNIWITVGIMYYQIDQYRDSLDAIAAALRLNVNIWEAWYNVAILVGPFKPAF